MCVSKFVAKFKTYPQPFIVHTNPNTMSSIFEDNDFVCRHLKLTKADIVKEIREKGFTSFSEIQDETDAGTICGSCVADIEEILEEELERQRNAAK